jgi:hypothetical protein
MDVVEVVLHPVADRVDRVRDAVPQAAEQAGLVRGELGGVLELVGGP